MIFSELYGTYYNTVAKILEKALCAPITTEELYSCIKENAYDESLIPITDAINKEKWQLLKFDCKKNNYSSITKHNPKMPLTLLQRQYLKALLTDKRIRLFDLDFDFLEKELSNVEPLWRPQDFAVFDQYHDGDNFEDEDYKARFRMILKAKENGKALDFTLKNRHGKEFKVSGIPEKIEYSQKDDKFRLVLLGKSKAPTINLGRIVSLAFAENYQKNNTDFQKTETDTIVLELTDERNALERVSMHFANLKKRTIKIDENKYKMELEFKCEDVTEMVIRLLQFGPVIKVLEPSYVVAEIVKRIGMQFRLIES